MNLSHELATHLRQLYTGGNWTSVNLRDTLSDVGWEQATTRVASFNTIAALVYHINYYVDAVLKVLEGGPLEASDKYSFSLPPIGSETQWKEMVERSLAQAERFATAIEALPEVQSAERNRLGIRVVKLEPVFP